MPFSAGVPQLPTPRAPTISRIRLHLSLLNPRLASGPLAGARGGAPHRIADLTVRTGDLARQLPPLTATRLAASTRRLLLPRFPSARRRHGCGQDDPSILAPAKSPHLGLCILLDDGASKTVSELNSLCIPARDSIFNLFNITSERTEFPMHPCS